MNGADTLGMCLYDYQAALHHWSAAHSEQGDGDPPPFTPDELEALFDRVDDKLDRMPN